MKAFVLDPGHGGKDSGTVNSSLSLLEKDINLAIVLAIKNLLPNFSITLTRDKDLFVPLKERTDLANKLNLPLISIHCNASLNKEANGCEVWCKTNKLPNKGNKPAEYSEEYHLSNCINQELASLGLKNRGVKYLYNPILKKFYYSPLWIVNKTNYMGIIVEAAFLSNNKEAILLRDETSKFAEAISKGITAYYL